MKIQQQAGVTLIELMITLAVIAVISAIAIPLYTNYIATARNTEAHNNLAAIKLAQEEFFLENNDYFTGADYAALQSSSGGLWQVQLADGQRNFDYKVDAVGTTGYVATATGRGGSYKVPDTVSFTVGN